MCQPVTLVAGMETRHRLSPEGTADVSQDGLMPPLPWLPSNPFRFSIGLKSDAIACRRSAATEDATSSLAIRASG